MDVAEALARLTQDSSQIERALVLDAGGALLGSTIADEAATERLAASARELATAASELHTSGGEVTRVEVELDDGAVFVLREGNRTIAAVTGPRPTSGLVAYDLRTCLHGIDEAPKGRRRRAQRTNEDAAE